jgi:hypothetical protein
MTAANGADAPKSNATPSGRAESGRFGSGNAFARGRPKQSLTRELRRITDVTGLARELHDMATDANTPKREKLAAIAMIFDRLEGRAVSRSMVMSVGASSLPPGFASMDPDRQNRVLDDLRQRALAGEMPQEDDDEET